MYRIDEVLKNKGITKTKLASMLGISKGTLSNNLKEPSMQTLKNISETLKIPLLDLFEDDRLPDKELTALIDYKGNLYKANSFEELDKVVNELKKGD